MSTLPFTAGTDYNLVEPYRIRGRIVHGFKRGSTQLGFPTANVDPIAFSTPMKDAKHGVYFGWAQALPYTKDVSTTDTSTTTTTTTTEETNTSEDAAPAHSRKNSQLIEKLHCQDYGVFKCMLSLGKNVQFDAVNDTLEAYIHHNFVNNFYDHQIEIIICGYIRPQLTFESLDALIDAIKRDVEIGEFSLNHHDEVAQLKEDEFFTQVKPNDDGLTVEITPGTPQ